MTRSGIIADASTETPLEFYRRVVGPPKSSWDRLIEDAERRGEFDAADELRAIQSHVAEVFNPQLTEVVSDPLPHLEPKRRAA